MLNDIKPENVRAAVEYTMEHGVYSRSSPAKPIGEAKPAQIPAGRRAPNTCIPWEEEMQGYRNLSGDVALVKNSWQSVDAAAYNYIWTSVLW